MIQEVILNTISSPSFSGGMKITNDTNNSWGLPKPSPVFSAFASSASVPPNGIGNDNECNVKFAWVDDGYLYMFSNSGLGTAQGAYRYLIDTNDPFGVTYNAMQARSNFTGGGEFWSAEGHIYSPGDNAVLVQTNMTGGGSVTYSLSRHEMSTWPFTNATATWQAVPSDWTNLVTNGTTRVGQVLLDRTRNKLYVSSWGSCKVITLNWTTGAFLGEWIIPGGGDVAGVTQPFRMLGLDPSTGYVLGGSYHANGGAGAFYFWDPSTATAWSTVGNAVLPAITSSYNRGRFWEHGAAPALLYWYYGRYYVGMQPEDIPLVGFNSGSIVGKVFVPQHWGYQYGMPAYRIYDISEEEFNDIWIGRTNSIGRSGSGTFGLNIVKPIYIDGNPWMFFHSQGTLDHYAEQSSPPNTAGIMACHAGVGSVILDVSSLFTESSSPKKILISQGTDSLDSEFSPHYSKWRFSCRVNSGSWSTPRCGPAELHNLSVEVNGKAGWGPFASTDTVELKAECTSGFLHSFASVQGNPGDRTTPNVKTADIGIPRDVLAIFQYEATNSPETYSFSGSVTLQKQ